MRNRTLRNLLIIVIVILVLLIDLPVLGDVKEKIFQT